MEHMRRIHLEEPATALLTQDASMDHTQHTGSKRKKKDTGVHRGAEEGPDPTLRAELKRLRKENKQMAQDKRRLMVRNMISSQYSKNEEEAYLYRISRPRTLHYQEPIASPKPIVDSK